MTTPTRGPGYDVDPTWYCGGRKRPDDPPCTQRAGWGTDHLGIGCCKLHGGCTPTHVVSADRVRRERQIAAARERYGIPVDVEADEAMSGLLAQKMGEVTYLTAIVAGLGREELKQRDLSGRFEKPAVWVEMLWAAQRDLRQIAKDMIDIGFAERIAAYVGEQGALLNGGIDWLLERFMELLVERLGVADEVLRALAVEAEARAVRPMLEALAAGRAPAVETGGAA